MRKISAESVRAKTEELFLKANTVIRPDILKALEKAYKAETKPQAKGMLQVIIKNAAIAKRKKLPLCQDTGLPVIFAEIGEKVLIEGSLKKALLKGAEDAYKKYAFRKSAVSDPVLRKAPFKHGPAFLYVEFAEGTKLKITAMVKGFGSENKTSLKMMNPTASRDEIEDFVIACLKEAQADACPPYIIGVGIGGMAETAILLAKKALLLPADSRSNKKHLSLMEKSLLKKINKLNIGVMGLGGKATCLQVRILVSATHIAGLPVAVNVGCHATRSAGGTL